VGWWPRQPQGTWGDVVNGNDNAPPGPPPPPIPTGAGMPVGYPTPLPATNGTAIASLCCAVGAWLICPIIPAIVALVLANKAEAEIATAGGFQRGQDLTRIARILAWIHLALAGVALVIAVLFGIAVVMSNN